MDAYMNVDIEILADRVTFIDSIQTNKNVEL